MASDSNSDSVSVVLDLALGDAHFGFLVASIFAHSALALFFYFAFREPSVFEDLSVGDCFHSLGASPLFHFRLSFGDLTASFLV